MIPQHVSRVLAAHGLTAIEFESGSTATSQLAADRLGVRVGQSGKSLLFLGKDGQYVMLLCPGDRKVSSAKLKAALGVKTRMARPEEALAATGFEPGGVCPFGIDEGIRIRGSNPTPSSTMLRVRSLSPQLRVTTTALAPARCSILCKASR